MENYSINISDEALQDLRNIYEYIAYDLEEPEIAAAQVNRIRKEIHSLDTFPNRYRLVEWEPWGGHGVRQLAVKHYLVFYTTDNERYTVNVLRVFYGRRDIPSIVGHD